MARQRDWEAEGRAAILALLGERLVVPWHEAEARISQGWGGFAKVQPLQLTAARRQLQEADQIVVEHTDHSPSVVTVRLPFRKGHKREIERLRGERRKEYRKYLAWATDEARCGRAGERALQASLEAAASPIGLYVPPQKLGNVDEVAGTRLTMAGPLDAYAYVLDLDEMPPAVELPLVVEVKNVHEWLYPWDRRPWMMLVKAAELAVDRPVVPLLACASAAWTTLLMAKDVGFFVAAFGAQLFSPDLIDAEDFEYVRDEFGLNIVQDEGPQDAVIGVLKKLLRQRPPPPPPDGEDTPFYRRQAARFSVLAPHILDFRALAGPLDDRTNAFRAFRARVGDVATWDLGGGW